MLRKNLSPHNKSFWFGAGGFDDLGEMLVNITKTLIGIPKELVNRQLYDLPVISPESSKLLEIFFETYFKKRSSLKT
jgi:hypothetical protein